MDAEACIFDIGNVLVRFDFEIAASKLRARSLNSSDEARSAVEHLKLRYENGDLSRQEFDSKAIETLGFQGSVSDFEAIWQEIFFDNPAIEPLVKQIAVRHPLYLLSNTSDLHLEYLLKRFPVFRYFKDGVYSFSAKHSKPDPEIFEIAIEHFGVIASKTLYIDDLEPNIQAARKAGLITFHYDLRRNEDLSEFLRLQR